MAINLIDKKDSLNFGREKLNNAILAFNETLSGDSSLEAAAARVDGDGNTFINLKDRLDTKDTNVRFQLAEKAKQTDLEVEKARIDNIVALPPTVDNAETTDIRIGADGVTYTSAGSAVRTQIGNVANDVDDIRGLKKITMIDGYNINLGVNIGTAVDLTPSPISGWKYAIVNCTSGDKFTVSGTGGVNPRLWGFVDSNNNLLTRSTISITATNSIITAPVGASKLIINSSTNDVSHTGKANSISVSKSISDISVGYGENLVEYAVGGNIKTGLTVGQAVNTAIEDVTNYIHVVKACSPGDKFKVNGVGGVNPRLWAFVDSNNVLLSVQTDNFGYKTNTIITAPDNSTKLIVNFDITTGNPTELFLYNKNNVEENANRIVSLETIKSINLAKNYILGNITTGLAIGQTVDTTVANIANYRCVIVDCLVGDKFRVYGTGGINPRLWAFIDSNNKLLSVQDSSEAYVETDVVITAPINASKLIVNFNVPTYESASSALLCTYDNATVENNGHKIEQVTKKSYESLCEVTDDTMTAFANGIKFSEELQNPITDFKKDGDLMVHVSSFCIINDIVYVTYYANTVSAAENPAQHTARFVYCPLNNVGNKTFVDLCNVGDIINGKTVTAIYDTILLRKDDATLYLMWTVALDGEYYRVYKTFDVSTGAISDASINTFTVGATISEFSISGMSSSLDENSIVHKPLNGDIGIMQKLSTRVEGGTTYYYTGAYVGAFNCIIKSSDLINWIFVSQPDFLNDSQWENAVYVVGDIVYYFCRQYSYSQFGFLTSYDLIRGQWASPVMLYDAQSRSDFFEHGGKLYLVHAPKDRNHISIMQVNQTNLNRSVEVQVAKVPDYFYPFTQIYNGESYMSFTQSRQHIWLSKFTLGSISTDTILDKFMQLFL